MFLLVAGVFVGCDPDLIWAGAGVHISIQNGLVKERLSVQIDPERQMLFVRSRHRLNDVIKLINNGGTDPLSPQPSGA